MIFTTKMTKRLPDCPGQTPTTTNLHSSSSTMATSRVPSPSLPEVNTPDAENLCDTQKMADKCTEHNSHHQPHVEHGHNQNSHHQSDNHSLQHHSSEHGHKTHVWNAEEYEKKVNAMDYNGPKLVVNHFAELNLPKSSRIIDLAAGTGLVGCLLRDNGYTNLDALDGSAEMLAMAKERNCYTNLITFLISKDTKLPIDDHTYDHIIMAGCLCHIDYESLPQIVRICKPGGIICWSIGLSEDIKTIESQFSGGRFENYIESLCAQNVWKFLSGYPKRVDNFALGRDGWVYMMEVL